MDLSLPGAISHDVDILLQRDEHERKKSCLFLMHLKEERMISQAAIQDVVSGCQDVLHTVGHLKAAVSHKLSECGLDASYIDGVASVFQDGNNPFAGVESQYLQETFIAQELGFIEPVEVQVGSSHYVTRLTGSKRRKVLEHDNFYYIPILSTLKQLLQIEFVRNELSRTVSQDVHLRDFCGGEAFKNNSSFNLHPHGLQIVAYYDEVETCNPLGSSSGKYKLGCIFFTLGNIRPSFRSSLKSIFLVAVARSSTIKTHGIDVLLKPFVDDLKVLHDVGIKMGQDEVWKSALLAFLADNLAAHELGGFKQSFSFAHRFCRSCMATEDDSRTNFRECEFTLRDPISHVQQCSLLEGHDSVKSSVEYGINRRSLLDEIPCFSVVKAMPHDIMHDLFEGVIPYELKLLIDHCSIANSYFSLATLNHQITAFDYGYSEIGDKPALIRECKLRQTASQMWLLARTFPLLVGDLVPRDCPNWLCFLKLIKICEICTSAVLTADYVAYLEILIEEHHLDFVKLYPTESVIPKMHSMVHFPQQILNYGPLVHTWTMRHEAKLRVIKRAARVSNFKNVCKTVAKRHQHLLCFYIQSNLLIRNIVKIGVCKPFHTCSQPETLKLLLNTNIMILSFVTSSGVTYKPHAYILFKNDELSPIFFVKYCLFLRVNMGRYFWL